MPITLCNDSKNIQIVKLCLTVMLTSKTRRRQCNKLSPVCMSFFSFLTKHMPHYEIFLCSTSTSSSYFSSRSIWSVMLLFAPPDCKNRLVHSSGHLELNSLVTYFFVLFPHWANKVVIETLSPSCAEDGPEDVYNLQTLQTLAFNCLSSCPLVVVKQSLL